jgi:lysyl-tRNA synthetase class 2
VRGLPELSWNGAALDFGRPFRRFTMREALTHLAGVPAGRLDDTGAIAEELRARGLPAGRPAPGGGGEAAYGHLLMALFEHLVEPQLVQPTFILDYPVEVSPFAKQRKDDPRFTERFELYVAGMELANGFSELNDPEVQAERFRQQLRERERGDAEAHLFDLDYVQALEHAMPPAGGVGLGVDRLAMVLADRPSIRDVILFPLLKPAPAAATGQEAAAVESAAEPARRP